MSAPGYNIAAVERDTGLSKDVLRVWERRYGFPVPERDANGERVYPVAQVERLRTIKRLMDQGHRPGKLMATTEEELATLGPRRNRPASGAHDPAVAQNIEGLLEMVRRHDAPSFTQAMQQRLARTGIAAFVQDTIAPLAERVGHAWEEGVIAVYEEHLFTELTKRVLRQAIAAVPPGTAGPRVLLTTAPEEQHVLGLLMVEALLVLDGATCVPLGTQMPLPEIAQASAAHRADVVALSFSAAFPKRRLPSLLEQLRSTLPPATALWAGGAGIAKLAPLDGIELLHSLDEVRAAVVRWQAAGSDGAATIPSRNTSAG